MQIRFRILKGHHDPELARVSRQADLRNNPFRFVGAETRRESVPQAVSAVEGTASPEQLRTLLEGGELRLRDLVNVGNGWETLGDCLVLDEITAPYRRRAALLKMLLRAGVLGLIVAAMAWVFWFFDRG